jgi:hypothetical protein
MDIEQRDITYHAIHHQRWAQHYHKAAWAALDCGYWPEAAYHQAMAAKHYEHAWRALLSLIMVDPII